MKHRNAMFSSLCELALMTVGGEVVQRSSGKDVRFDWMILLQYSHSGPLIRSDYLSIKILWYL